jgi:protein-S-isoprenylcysteine O-methyltransferase Ste14
MSRFLVGGGAVLFAASLAYFAFVYVTAYGDRAGWTSAPDVWMPVVFDVMLFTIFALHHSVFARLRVRTLVERFAPEGSERAIYVWVASLLFLCVCAGWLPVPGVLWATTGVVAGALTAIQLAGIALIVVAVRRLGVLTLAGLSEPEENPVLADDGAYALVRHPIYLGWFLVVWAPAVMTGTRLVFAVVSCAYLVVAVTFEERDLRRNFGEAYERYAARVRSRILPRVY